MIERKRIKRERMTLEEECITLDQRIMLRRKKIEKGENCEVK